MRVLLLNRYSQEQTAGGVAEYLDFLPRALKPLGIETVAYNEDPSETGKLVGPRLASNGVTVYAGPFPRPSFFLREAALQPLIDVCRREKIDLVHAQGVYRCGFIAYELFKRIRMPYIITSHADIVASHSDRMKRGNVRRRCQKILKHAAGVTHLTPMMADIAHEIMATREKSVVIGNGIDVSAWQSYSELPEQPYVIGIGRLEREKGFHILIDAFAKLHAQGSTLSLVIAGSGKAEADLHAQAEQLNLQVVKGHTDFLKVPPRSIVFTGYLKGDAKQQWVGRSQLVVFPTQPHLWDEPFGIVQLEGMAAGKYIIASDSKTTRYLQTLGMQAQLVTADDSDAWANALDSALQQEVRRQQGGCLNREQAKQFDWEQVGECYAAFYRESIVGRT